MRLAVRPMALAMTVLAVAACSREPRSGDVVLATTTSVEDTGLMEVLNQALREELPQYRVRVIAVGSGQAMELARRGDADVVLVHDPAAETRFVEGGYGDRRRTIMRNDFIVVGPRADPAGIATARTTADAFRLIAASGALFLSRGDSSGTHRKELSLWRDAGVQPRGGWYREAGVGQGDLLRMASERGAYALVDRGTFRFHETRVDLVVLHSDEPPLDNPYSAIVATRAPNPEGGLAVAEWLAGARARSRIAAYGTDRFGSPLFDVVR